MSVFADSSALVKLYVDESGAEAIRAEGDLVASELARVEVAAALARKRQAERRSESTSSRAEVAFAADWSGVGGPRRFAVIAVSSAVVERAAGLVGGVALRAYDAVQLASLEAAGDAGLQIGSFACFDRRLREVAATRGHQLVPATLEAISP